MSLKSVLITGCSSGGIGSALAAAFQKRNLHVFATARNPSKMSHLEKMPNITVLTLDPTSESSVNAAVESVKATTGGTLDYLVNNAGQTIIMPTLDFDVEIAKSMYDINVWGMYRVTQAFAPLVIESKGTIVNISSISTVVHTPWMGVYAASKAAVTMISETLRLELAPFGVKVVTVCTGLYLSIEKEIAARARGDDGFTRMDTSIYAEKVVSDVLGGANGQVWRGTFASINRFMSSWFPSLLDPYATKGTGLDVLSRKA